MTPLTRHAIALGLLLATGATMPAWAQAADASSATEATLELTPSLGADTGFRHHRTAVGDVRLHYVRGGEGEPLILLHGWPTTWWEWHKIMPGLAETFDVIAVDTRGLGDSTRPESGYEKDVIGEDIVALARQLGLTRFSIAGHDLGGQVAFAIARNHPEMVQRLAILDVPLMGMPYSEALAPWHFAFNAVPDLPEALTQGRERIFLDIFWSGFTYNPRGFDEADIQEFLRSYTAVGAMHAGFNYYRAFDRDAAANRAWFEAGNKLDMPVLWLGGEGTAEADIAGAGLISTGNLLELQLENAATDLRGQSLAGCGHWLASECPERTEQLLNDFFSGN
ncbi:alpha/beta fold hydrolase [Pseudooceanicola sp. 216_PA32_1]|uniref:Alpha/beta fold hydrolase n=1 Tax=Pseudooceanicola pacificus TaxID=2676438 RepID=A0A844W3E9_9RHOB|nr:alpha/beta hydrolase [Pseudooceanicola pacificus]MWB78327.1 alpha/beta fold hydrolase [Pseudooceanicola pacificus]